MFFFFKRVAQNVVDLLNITSLVCKKVYKTLIIVGIETNGVWNVRTTQEKKNNLNFFFLFLFYLIVMVIFSNHDSALHVAFQWAKARLWNSSAGPCRRFLQQFCKQMNTTATLPHTPALLYNPNYRGNLKRSMLSDDLPL